MADLNTKKLSRSRREFLEYLINIVDYNEENKEHEVVGKEEFESYVYKKSMSNHLKEVRRSMLRTLAGKSNGSAGVDFVRTLALCMLQPVSAEIVVNDTSLMIMSWSDAVERLWYVLILCVILSFGVGILVGRNLNEIVSFVKWLKREIYYKFVYYVLGRVIVEVNRRDSLGDQEAWLNPLLRNFGGHERFQ